jgi:hypothetical protein
MMSSRPNTSLEPTTVGSLASAPKKSLSATGGTAYGGNILKAHEEMSFCFAEGENQNSFVIFVTFCSRDSHLCRKGSKNRPTEAPCALRDLDG